MQLQRFVTTCITRLLSILDSIVVPYARTGPTNYNRLGNSGC